MRPLIEMYCFQIEGECVAPLIATMFVNWAWVLLTFILMTIAIKYSPKTSTAQNDNKTTKAADLHVKSTAQE